MVVLNLKNRKPFLRMGVVGAGVNSTNIVFIIFIHPEETTVDKDDDTKEKWVVSLIEQLKGKLEKGKVDLLEESHIDLPILPTIGNKINQFLQDTDISINDVIRFSEKEPVIASKILAISNSPSYAGWEKYDNLEGAISRIGLKSILRLPLAMIVRTYRQIPQRSCW